MADQEEILQKYWEPHDLEAGCRVVAKTGRVSDDIARIAREEGAGMIVMGAFGHNPIHELFFGSTTLETMAKTECPVLLMV